MYNCEQRINAIRYLNYSVHLIEMTLSPAKKSIQMWGTTILDWVDVTSYNLLYGQSLGDVSTYIKYFQNLMTVAKLCIFL